MKQRSVRPRTPPSQASALATATTLATETVRQPAVAPRPAARPEPPRPTIGTVLGKYELVGYLGRGATSVVFLGRHRKLQMPVAVKVLNRDALANSPQLLGQLVSEAVLLAKLNHPN